MTNFWLGSWVAASMAASVMGCAPPTADAAASEMSAVAIDPAPSTRVGEIELGVYAAEVAGISDTRVDLPRVANADVHRRLREAILTHYGAPLPEANYFSVRKPGWDADLPLLETWLRMAAVYGTPTLAFEPIVEKPWDVFRDGPEMTALAEMFKRLGDDGIEVRVRFASEANLWGSPYSATRQPGGIDAYKRAARWFRKAMPGNVKLIFSPLINTPIEGKFEGYDSGLEKMKQMYEKGVYDFIGGTVYSSANYTLRQIYDRYVKEMRSLDATTPLHICELGGPISQRQEVLGFIRDSASGRYPGLVRINIFGSRVNGRRENELGPHGTLMSGSGPSYLRDLFKVSTSASLPRREG